MRASSTIVRFDVVVIGGGAAGLFCAIEAGKRGRRVVVLEHNDRVGKKIRISGGGRCNFTNIHTSPDNFISGNAHFCKSALARYTAKDFVALVESYGIRYHEKTLGQLFCDGSAQAIIDMLLDECHKSGAEIRCGVNVKSVNQGSCFEIETGQGVLLSDSLVVATGGLSVPSMGATDFGYRIARQFGLNINSPRPGLVPFIVSSDEFDELRTLSGISVSATARCNGSEFRENVLLTHRGLSGPAILQISSYWKTGDVITLNLMPEINGAEMLISNRQSSIELPNLLSRYLPRRFAQAWCNLYVSRAPLHNMAESELREVGLKLSNWMVFPEATEGYKKAEVTVGGVDTNELSSKTLEAKKRPGLFLIGEVVDVTGHLGGHNFQWAWSSGYAAGQYC